MLTRYSVVKTETYRCFMRGLCGGLSEAMRGCPAFVEKHSGGMAMRAYDSETRYFY